jgi:hypothetical protein
MWGHYGSRIAGVFLRPFSKTLDLTIDILQWYKLFFYGKLCPIYFFKEWGFGGSVFVF